MAQWLNLLAGSSLILAAACTMIIAADLLWFPHHRQRMWIMNLVWPVTALYAGPIGLWAYVRVGRLSSRGKASPAAHRHGAPPSTAKPFWQSVAVGSTHCGGGCTLGDLTAEWWLSNSSVTLFGKAIFAAWALDFLLAYLFGIAFQYYSIKPMRGLPPLQGLVAAVKADTLSLVAWQVGMYGWMAIATFVLFGHELDKTGPVFWFMMQLAMIAGFCTSYPVNWWLIRRGIKERM